MVATSILQTDRTNDTVILCELSVMHVNCSAGLKEQSIIFNLIAQNI